MEIATHAAPAWGPKADFIIRADLTDHGMPGHFEQLWARKVENAMFEICCVPFFTYGIALGDRVECDSFHTQRVTVKRGHRVLRIAASDKNRQHELHTPLRDWVEKTGFLYEFCQPGYVAIDLPPGADPNIHLSNWEEFADACEIKWETDASGILAAEFARVHRPELVWTPLVSGR
jgi:hypothetical protein